MRQHSELGLAEDNRRGPLTSSSRRRCRNFCHLYCRWGLCASRLASRATTPCRGTQYVRQLTDHQLASLLAAAASTVSRQHAPARRHCIRSPVPTPRLTRWRQRRGHQEAWPLPALAVPLPPRVWPSQPRHQSGGVVTAVAGGARWTREAAEGMRRLSRPGAPASRLTRACSCGALQTRWLAEAVSTAEPAPTFTGGWQRHTRCGGGPHDTPR